MIAQLEAARLNLYRTTLPVAIDAVLILPCLFLNTRHSVAPERIIAWAMRVSAEGKTEAILRCT